jgi:O-antigen/teichoic acid export membrane protein
MLGVLAVILSVAFAYVAPALFNIPESLVDDTRIIVVLGGLTVAATLIGGIFGGIVTGLQRFDAQCGLEIFLTTARATAFVIALREGHGLVSLAVIQLASSILYCILFWAASRRLYPGLRLRFRGALFPQMRTLLSFGASLSVIYVFARLISYSDVVVIAAFLPIEAVAFFAIAGHLSSQAGGIATSLSYVMTPRVSALMSMGSNSVGEEVLGVARIAALIAAPIAATFILRGESFINLWMGPDYGPVSGPVLLILAMVLWLEAPRAVVMQSITGMARQKMLIPGVIFEAACKLALSIALVLPLGIVGAALSTLVASMLMSLGYIPVCLAKVTGVPVRRFYRNCVLLPATACVPFALASATTERFLPAANLADFFAQTVLILFLVPVAAWLLCLTDAEKKRVAAVVRGALVR